jgi:hypothetical protein
VRVIALIGDIVESKSLERRAAFQRRLTQVLAVRNREAVGLASPFTITLGDEFQAVYRSADSLWADVVEILAALHPVRARFAIGAGALSTRLNPEQALGMDGPAFHRARAAMTMMKETGVGLRVSAEDEEDWELARHSLALISHHFERWHQTRFRILAGLLLGRPVRELESALKISKVAVYKNINVAALDEITAILHEISRALNHELPGA